MAVHAIERKQSQEALRMMLRVMLQGGAQEKLQVVAVAVTMQQESRLWEGMILAEKRILAAAVVEEQRVDLAAMMVRELVHEREVGIVD